ncbi:aspartyl-phosphate phosphatase Spo0E family protein [Natroniella sulfidigena]|uniref:aspartyl-phosphate phosphatase Spo0E family protein n=1 Tax=Natroniella sulfidigena TaxID=723921 RepID=UPI00200A6CED|nr:aspartyl-phosphate phosphatase Spo0E family protein [Natroniella sulfidigena]MCK8818017.1 aspartyl-phosphate phosphatase Spo0E family protein [Natroniella sulfidigena]
MDLDLLKEEIERKRRELNSTMKNGNQKAALKVSRELDQLICEYMSLENNDTVMVSYA